MSVSSRPCGCIVENGRVITTCGKAGHGVGTAGFWIVLAQTVTWQWRFFG